MAIIASVPMINAIAAVIMLCCHHLAKKDVKLKIKTDKTIGKTIAYLITHN